MRKALGYICQQCSKPSIVNVQFLNVGSEDREILSSRLFLATCELHAVDSSGYVRQTEDREI